jgi:hypothetical protein
MSGASRGRELRKDVEAELIRLGVRRYEFGISHGHQFVLFWVADRQSRVFFPQTPSDRRQDRNTIAELRRRLRNPASLFWRAAH